MLVGIFGLLGEIGGKEEEKLSSKGFYYFSPIAQAVFLFQFEHRNEHGRLFPAVVLNVNVLRLYTFTSVFLDLNLIDSLKDIFYDAIYKTKL